MRKQVANKDAHQTASMPLRALREGIARSTEDGERHSTAVLGLSLFRREVTTELISGMDEPSDCVVAQGAGVVNDRVIEWAEPPPSVLYVSGIGGEGVLSPRELASEVRRMVQA